MAFLTLFQLSLVLATSSSVLAHHRPGHYGGFGSGNASSATTAVAAVSTTTTAAAGLSTSTSAVTTSVDVNTASVTTTSAASTSIDLSAASSSDTGVNNNRDKGTVTTSAAAAATSTTSTTGNTGSSGDLALDPANVQAASDSDGGAVAEAGQSPSLTDPANFINFCTGQTLTNGTQITAGSCNGVVMGEIPANTNMISTIITNPQPGDTITSNQNFTVTLQVTNLEAGSFTNPNTAYYSAPQTLKNGNIVGHTHITIQTLGNSISTTTPPDPAKFMFFKGVNDDGNGQGGLSALVAGGLPAGAYRVCTMTSASNHQPVLMPVAQRGAQDDCTKFTVADGAQSNNPASNGGNQNGKANVETTAQTTAGAAYGGRRIRRWEARRY